MKSLTIGALITRLAKKDSNKVYYISADNGRALTYGELYQQCLLLGQQFDASGLERDDKVSVYMPNCEQTAVLLLAIMAHGLVANPINLMSQPSQLLHVLRHSDTRMVFTTPELAAVLQPLLAEIDRPIQLVRVDPLIQAIPAFACQGGVQVDANASANPTQIAAIGNATHTTRATQAAGGTDLREAAAGSSPSGCSGISQPDWNALLMYTSGTTGVPKGVLLTQENLLENALYISREHLLTASDRVLGSLPLYHINGLVVTLVAPLMHEGSVAMTSRFSVATFWQDAIRYGCTWINVVPTIIAYLLNDTRDAEAWDLGRLRFCRSASSALSPEHLVEFEERFGIGIIETMGLTETAAPAFSNPYRADHRKIGSIGMPSGTQAKVVDDQGRTVPNGQHGEIIIRGKNVMRGYYKDPQRTRDAFTPDGWLRTGDIGFQDDDGFFYVIGRAKELIIKGGENIAPREIDEAVVKHPCVLDAAAVGIPHPEYGQDIAVYLVLRENAVFDDGDMRRHCLNELGKYKSPSKYVVVAELPRGPSGKVQRLKLTDL